MNGNCINIMYNETGASLIELCEVVIGIVNSRKLTIGAAGGWRHGRAVAAGRNVRLRKRVAVSFTPRPSYTLPLRYYSYHSSFVKLNDKAI